MSRDKRGDYFEIDLVQITRSSLSVPTLNGTGTGGHVENFNLDTSQQKFHSERSCTSSHF